MRIANAERENCRLFILTNDTNDDWHFLLIITTSHVCIGGCKTDRAGGCQRTHYGLYIHPWLDNVDVQQNTQKSISTCPLHMPGFALTVLIQSEEAFIHHLVLLGIYTALVAEHVVSPERVHV